MCNCRARDLLLLSKASSLRAGDRASNPAACYFSTARRSWARVANEAQAESRYARLNAPKDERLNDGIRNDLFHPPVSAIDVVALLVMTDSLRQGNDRRGGEQAHTIPA